MSGGPLTVICMTTTTTAKILGTTDEHTACDCCGRTNLRRTVAIDFDGTVAYYGTSCAETITTIPAADITAAASIADKARLEAERAEHNAQQAAAAEAWEAWLTANAGPGDVADQIDRLGGYSAARTAYRSAA